MVSDLVSDSVSSLLLLSSILVGVRFFSGAVCWMLVRCAVCGRLVWCAGREGRRPGRVSRHPPSSLQMSTFSFHISPSTLTKSTAGTHFSVQWAADTASPPQKSQCFCRRCGGISVVRPRNASLLVHRSFISDQFVRLGCYFHRRSSSVMSHSLTELKVISTHLRVIVTQACG